MVVSFLGDEVGRELETVAPLGGALTNRHSNGYAAAEVNVMATPSF
jgi:hypothetical protein